MVKQNKSDVDIISEMVTRNLDVKCSATLVQAQLRKRGGEITFGVDNETYSQITKGAVLETTHHSLAFFINKKQYEEIRDRSLTGLELVKKERMEMFTKHNRTVEKDVVENADEDLRAGALALITNKPAHFSVKWDSSICNKMMNKSYRDKLVIAAALLIAEIDRIQAEENLKPAGV